MIGIIESYLFGQGFIKVRDENRYINHDKEITIYLSIERYTACINSKDISIDIRCEFDQIFDIVDKILEDPWKYQKHLIRSFMDCVDYFDEHYDKELRNLGLTRNPTIQSVEVTHWNDSHRVRNLELRYKYGHYDYIWFPYHPGIESIISYINYDDNRYINFTRTDKKNLIEEIIKHYPEITHLVEGTKERYLEYKEYKEDLRDKHRIGEPIVVKLDDFMKKYPIEWIENLKLIGRNITIV